MRGDEVMHRGLPACPVGMSRLQGTAVPGPCPGPRRPVTGKRCRTSNTTQPCTELFCPIYSLGLSPQPAVVEAADGPEPENPDIFIAGRPRGETWQRWYQRPMRSTHYGQP